MESQYTRFTKLVTPRGRSWYAKRTDAADQWAYVKRDLANIGNAPAAGVFYATEMSIRIREESLGLPKIIGMFYEETCDFGNSISKPMLWFVFWFVLSGLVYWVLEFRSPSVVLDVSSCVGWMKGLCGEGSAGRFWRALHLTAQPMLNPLAGITGASVLVPGLPAYAYSVFHRILSLVLIFLIIVAIRRRFRLTVD